MGGYKFLFNGNWHCCVCRINNRGLLQLPNSAYSTTCEDRSCSHSRCGSCPQGGSYGGPSSSNTLSRQVAVPASPSQPRALVAQSDMEDSAGRASLLLERNSPRSSHSSIIERCTALSSTQNSRGATDVQTAATTASSAAKNADMNDSDNESVASSIDQFYSAFSTVLGNNLAQDLNGLDLVQSRDMLAARLEEFSVRFGNEDADDNHLRMMSIVYRHSRRIAAQICRSNYEAAFEDTASISDGSSLEASDQDTAIAEWLKDSGQEGFPTTTADEIAYHDNGEDQIISGHRMLLESEAYQWLVSVMQRTARLNGIDPICMAGHREKVSRHLQTVATQEAEKHKLRRLITSKRPPPRYIARFSLSWDLLNFLREEYEGENIAGVVGQAVTLTGDGHSVQAATCRGYLEQVWPTTGSEFLSMVEDMITRTGQSCKHVLSDRTEISARLDDGSCLIEAFGTDSGLGDVAEQLLWISTALRMPSAIQGMALCSAELVPTNTGTQAHRVTLLDKECYRECLGVVAFRVAYTANPLPEGAWHAEGDCWMELFSSFPVVTGYPIPSRNPRRPGLEIPLDIMAPLIGADRITPFGNDLIIKGYSELFYATEYNNHCVMWHLIRNKSDTEGESSRISFADRRIPQSTGQILSLLRPVDALCMRHIVGWTSTVRSNAGAPDAEYSPIISSDLGPPPQGWALDRVQVTAVGNRCYIRCSARLPINHLGALAPYK